AALANTKAVDSLVSDDHHGPAKRSTPRRVKRSGSAPDIRETFLQNIFCLFGVIHHSVCHPVKGGRKALIERRECRLVSISDLADQVCLKLALWIVRQPCHTSRFGHLLFSGNCCIRHTLSTHTTAERDSPAASLDQGIIAKLQSSEFIFKLRTNRLPSVRARLTGQTEAKNNVRVGEPTIRRLLFLPLTLRT